MSYEYQNRDLFDGVVAIVEITKYEERMLWKEYRERVPDGEWIQSLGEWFQSLSGPLVTVGQVNGRPVCISLFVNTIGGKKVVFYEATSVMVDHDMIDHWFLDHLPDSALKTLNVRGADKQYPVRVTPANFFNMFGSVSTAKTA